MSLRMMVIIFFCVRKQLEAAGWKISLANVSENNFNLLSYL